MSDDQTTIDVDESNKREQVAWLNPSREMTDKDFRRIAWLRVIERLNFRDIAHQLQFYPDRVRRAATGLSGVNEGAYKYIQHLNRVLEARSDYISISLSIPTSWHGHLEPVSSFSVVRHLIARMPKEEVVELVEWMSKRHVDCCLEWFEKSTVDQGQ